MKSGVCELLAFINSLFQARCSDSLHVSIEECKRHVCECRD